MRKEKKKESYLELEAIVCPSSSGTQLGDEADVTLRGNYQPRTQA